MTKLKNKLTSKMRGFTLLELVIVIAIIGILAVIVLPNFIQALAKARDAKKMTELRGVQTFLTTTGIDTNLRYPATAAALKEWFTETKNRTPQGLTSNEYRYNGLNCDAVQQVKVGSKTYGGTAFTGVDGANNCSSYQLWTELESDNAALRLDADLVAACTAGAATGPCIQANTIDSAMASLPTATLTSIAAGDDEVCTARGAALTDIDCVFDLVP